MRVNCLFVPTKPIGSLTSVSAMMGNCYCQDLILVFAKKSGLFGLLNKFPPRIWFIGSVHQLSTHVYGVVHMGDRLDEATFIVLQP